MTHSAAITVTNRADAEAPLWIEPWGDFVALPAGAAVRVVAEATEPGQFEIAFGEGGGLAVWAWPSATVRCFDAAGGAEVKPGAFGVPVPTVPPGMTTSGFLRLVLGQGE